MSSSNALSNKAIDNAVAYISPMRVEDLPEIERLEQICFPTPWPIEVYQRELEKNPFGFYSVIRARRALTRAGTPHILAYGGLWLNGDEAHVMTVASHPDFRRYKLGAWMLLHMIEQARELAAHDVALEVRAGNDSALALYAGLGFEKVGLRRRYYPATADRPAEDAVLMTLHRIHEESVWRPLARRLAEARAAAVARLLAGV